MPNVKGKDPASLKACWLLHFESQGKSKDEAEVLFVEVQAAAKEKIMKKGNNPAMLRYQLQDNSNDSGRNSSGVGGGAGTAVYSPIPHEE